MVVCLLCLSTVTASGGATAPSPETYVAVEDVTVSPNPPDPDEEFTVFASVRNFENSSSHFDVERVELRGGPDQNFTLHDRTSVPGVVRPQESRYVRLTGTIDDPGTYSLRIHAYGTNEDDEVVEVQRTVEVRVGAERPQLSIDAGDPVANATAPVNVTVANGLPSDARNVRVDVSGDAISVENPRRVQSVLASGTDERFEFSVRADGTGTHRVRATLRYTDANGTEQTVRQHALVEFSSLSKRVSLDAQSAAEGSEVSVTVTNFGNVPITNVVLRGESPNATLTDAPVERVAPGESETVALNITQFEADGAIPVNVTATYEAGDVQDRTHTSVDIASNPGAIRLTGIDLEREDGVVHLSGSASNVGLSEANSVIVSVVPEEGVEPAHPNKEYFVGTVPASDFVSFDVYAQVEENVSSVPLKVAYLVDGERRTYTVTVEYDLDDGTPSAQSRTNDDLLVPAIVGLVVTLAVAGLMVFAWRNSRDETEQSG